MFKRYRPGEMPTAEDFNKIIDEVNSNRYRLTAGSRLETVAGGGGPSLRLKDIPAFWAKITYQDQVTGACDWIEVSPVENGLFQTLADSKSGDTQWRAAYEINGRLNLQTPFYTWLRQGTQWANGNQEWLFDHCCSIPGSSSSSSSSSSSGSTSTGPGNGVVVVDNVACYPDGGLQVDLATLTGTVTINGVQYPVSFTLTPTGG